MQQTKTLAFSPEHPTHARFTLLTLLQEMRNSNSLQGSLLTPLNASTILLLDAESKRARSIASLLSSAHYQSYIATNPLEAFTLFLQGQYVPFAIILGQYDPSARFFLTRLRQQIMQKYRWEPFLIPLQTHIPALPSPNTDPLPPARISAPTTSIPTLIAETSSQLFARSDSPLPQIPAQPAKVVTTAMLPARITDATPIINISTHDVPVEHNHAQKTLLEGLSIGRYHIKTLLGNGSIGQVYVTYDRLREQDIALKTIQMNALPPTMHTRSVEHIHFFQRELDLLSVLNHPHILFPLNAGKSYISGSPFIYKTMPYCAGGSLATILHHFEKPKLFSLQKRISVIMQIADALQHAHERSIIYQNFKLSNLLLRSKEPDTGNMHVLLTDFSIVQDGSFLLKTPDMFPYIAPEAWYGQALPASDQYSLAALTYELLTGRVLFQGHSEAIMRQLHTTMSPRPLTFFAPYISPAISNIVLRALAKRPEQRFPSVLHFAEALQLHSR